MARTSYLNVESADHVTRVTLNRPERCNALDEGLLCELEQCALGFRDDTGTRVVIFTGAGEHFSAGADLAWLREIHQLPMIEKRRRIRFGERVLHALLDIEQITICASNGAAIGGAACIAAALDLRIGSEGCFVCYPEIDLGMNLMWQALPRTVRMVGESSAIRVAIGGERIEAQTMHDWGLLDEIVPRSELLHRAYELAWKYAAKSPVAAQMIKRAINATGTSLDGAMMHADPDQHLLASLTHDHQQAVSGYLEKTTVTITGD